MNLRHRKAMAASMRAQVLIKVSIGTVSEPSSGIAMKTTVGVMPVECGSTRRCRAAAQRAKHKISRLFGEMRKPSGLRSSVDGNKDSNGSLKEPKNGKEPQKNKQKTDGTFGDCGKTADDSAGSVCTAHSSSSPTSSSAAYFPFPSLFETTSIYEQSTSTALKITTTECRRQAYRRRCAKRNVHSTRPMYMSRRLSWRLSQDTQYQYSPLKSHTISFSNKEISLTNIPYYQDTE